MIRALPLILALLLVASDSSEPAASTPGFEARVSGSASRDLGGTTRATDGVEGIGISLPADSVGVTLVFILDDAASEASIVLFGITAESLVEGAYPVFGLTDEASTAPAGGFVGLYLASDDTLPAISSDGELTITRLTDAQASGTFAFDAQPLAIPGEATEPVRAEGTFVVDLRDAPARTE